MTEKIPPVLSEWKVVEEVMGHIPVKEGTDVPVKKLLQAQRDADVKWFKENIGVVASLTLPVLIEREKAKVAREIFEETENTFGWITVDQHGNKKLEKITIDDGGYFGKEGSLVKWQALKSKHLKG